MILRILFITLLLLPVGASAYSTVSRPLTTDSRVRTMVYSENEVYKVATFFGYQANIEFRHDEKIKTISVGDQIPFKITPQNNRIFVKANQDGMITNMTVLTNKRSYLFELTSKKEDRDAQIYVMRFYYPDDGFNDTRTWENNAIKTKPRGIRDGVAKKEAGRKVERKLTDSNFNYKYTYVGPDYLKPHKIFDDGRRVYIEFPKGRLPEIRQVTPQGQEVPLQTGKTGEFTILDKVYPKMAFYYDNQVLCVFNEGYGVAGSRPVSAPAAPLLQTPAPAGNIQVRAPSVQLPQIPQTPSLPSAPRLPSAPQTLAPSIPNYSVPNINIGGPTISGGGVTTTPVPSFEDFLKNSQ